MLRPGEIFGSGVPVGKCQSTRLLSSRSRTNWCVGMSGSGYGAGLSRAEGLCWYSGDL